jgi:hypothetical protein
MQNEIKTGRFLVSFLKEDQLNLDSLSYNKAIYGRVKGYQKDSTAVV